MNGRATALVGCTIVGVIISLWSSRVLMVPVCLTTAPIHNTHHDVIHVGPHHHHHHHDVPRYMSLQWVAGYSRDCNRTQGHQCQPDPETFLMVSDTFTLDTFTVSIHGMWGRRKRKFGNPLVVATSEGSPHSPQRCSVYIVRFFDPFNWFEAVCRWPTQQFGTNKTTYLRLTGSAEVKGVAVGPYIEVKRPPDNSIGLCVSQFHHDVPSGVLLEFLEHYTMLGVTHVFIYDFDLHFDVLSMVEEYQRHRGVTITLIDWSPVRRFPSYCRGQILALNDCFQRSKTLTSYVLQVDIDEFLIPPNNVDPRGSLTTSVHQWRHTAHGMAYHTVFPMYDVLNVCDHHTTDVDTSNSNVLLETSRMMTRCVHPTADGDGPRETWGRPVADHGYGWAGFPKYLVSTDLPIYCINGVSWTRCAALHVHTVLTHHKGPTTVSEVVLTDTWRIHHYRGWSPAGRCRERQAADGSQTCMVHWWERQATPLSINDVCNRSPTQQRLMLVPALDGDTTGATSWACRRYQSPYIKDTTMQQHVTRALVQWIEDSPDVVSLWHRTRQSN